MPRDDRDPALLWDMDETARTIEAMMAGVTLEMFLSDRRLPLAVERALEIVGEAARGISEETRERAPSIPWRAIVAQRNVLSHEYGAIDQRRIFHVAGHAIRQLREQLRPLLTAPPGPVA